MAFHIATGYALEPGCQIFLRRLQLARRIFAKHPWTIETFKNIITAYETRGVIGAIAINSTAPYMDPCPLVALLPGDIVPTKATLFLDQWAYSSLPLRSIVGASGLISPSMGQRTWPSTCSTFLTSIFDPWSMLSPPRATPGS